MSNQISKDKLAAMLAEMRAKKTQASNVPVVGYWDRTKAINPGTIPSLNGPVTIVPETKEYIISEEDIGKTIGDVLTGTGRTGEAITYNERQAEFIRLASSGKSCVLIGAAGTGKTTCMQGAISALEQSGKTTILPDSDHHKYLPKGTPGIVIIAFTRRAVNNIRRVMPEHMKGNCITHHKLMEYEPVYDEITDEESGETKKTMRFQATRGPYNLLSESISTVIIEESSMYSQELENELKSALRHRVQFIYLGDIQQLPPVFGSAVLGYKMLELPIVELTEVYRQALESPIIRLAHRILSGKPIALSEYSDWKYPDQLTLHPWKKKLKWEDALMTAAKFFTTAMDREIYNAEEDIILIPFNKSFGSDELNKHIAQHVARKDSKTVYEVIAGFSKLYFFTGLKVLYDKEDAIITKIERNRTYFGKSPQKESPNLDFWGHNSVEIEPTAEEESIDDMDFLLEAVVSQGDGEDEDRVRAASHKITVQIVDGGREVEIDSAGALNNLILSYALTVHKSQGSEWRKVFLVLHQSHATMIQRELLYTGCTRAKQELYVICEPESFTKGILGQRIVGNSLAEKSEWFKGKVDMKKQLMMGGK